MAKEKLKERSRTGHYKLTSARLKRIKEALRLGASFKLVAHYAGVSEDTFRRWRRDAEHAKKGTLLDQLRVALLTDSAQGGITNLRRVDAAGMEGDVRAAMWMLERRHGYTKRVEVKGIPDREVQAMVMELLADARELLDPETYDELLGRWAERMKEWTGDELGEAS